MILLNTLKQIRFVMVIATQLININIRQSAIHSVQMEPTLIILM